MAGVRVVYSDGTTGVVSPKKLEGAIANGWHVETPEEAAQRTGGGPLRAAAEGLAAGAIEGATAPVRLANRAVEAVTGVNVGDKVVQGIDRATGGTGVGQTFEGATSGRKTLENIAAVGGGALTDQTGEAFAREYSESARNTAMANPVTSTAANIVGQLGAGALSGGAGALANLGKSATAALAARGAGTVAARAGGTALAGAVEGGLQGLADANEQTWLENVPQTADRVWANVGLGALLGGGTGVGLGAAIGKFEKRAAAKAALGATRSAEEEAIETVAGRALGTEPAPGLGGKLKEAVEGAAPSGRVGRAYEDVASALSGADKETVRKYGAHKVLMGDAEALNGLEMAMNRDAIIEGSIGEVTEAVSALKRESQDIMEQVVDSGLKREHVARLIADVDKDAALTAAREQAAGLRSKLSLLDDAEMFGDNKWAAGARKYVSDHLDDVMSGALGAEDSYMALDAVKRQLQKIGKKAEGGAVANAVDMLKRDQLQAYANLTKEAAEDVRGHLADDILWGKQGVAQKRANAAWEEYLRTNELAQRSLMTRTGDDYGRAVFEVDPAKVDSFMKGLGTQRAALTEKYVRDHLAATRGLVDEISQGYELAEHAAKVEAVRGAYGRIEQTLAKADKTVKVANQIGAMLEAEKSGAASVLGGSASLFGGVLGGIPGAAIGMWANAIMRPGSAALQSARLMALAGNTTKRVNGALRSFFGHASHSEKATGAVAKAIGRVATKETARRAVTGGALAGAQASGPADHRERVAELAANPLMLAKAVQDSIGQATSRLPDSHSALSAVPMRAVQFLSSKLPPAPPQHALDGASKAPISKIDQDRFNQYVKGATEPLAVLDDMAVGMATLQQVEAIQAVYPTLYDDIRQATFDYVVAAGEAKQPLPYAKRLQLDMLFGGNGAIEPSASPEYRRIIQQAAAPPPPPPARRSGGGKAPNFAETHSSSLNRLSRM